MNRQLAQQQGRYFHGELPVNNAAQPQYQLVTVTAETVTSITSEQGHVYVPRTPEMYTYDWNGNLASDGRWKYKWDAENRLIAMETSASAPAAARKKMWFDYDYMGRRISKTVQQWDSQAGVWQSGVTREFFYDDWNLVGEMENDVVVGRYVWGLDLSGSLQGAGGVGGLLTVTKDDNTLFALSDANGNVKKLYNSATQKNEGEYEYGPFGELIRMTGERAKANPFRFSSKYRDDESGLLYFGYRYYDTGVGRWLSRDPWSDYMFYERNIAKLFGSGFNDKMINYANDIGLPEPIEYMFNESSDRLSVFERREPNIYSMVVNSAVNYVDKYGLNITLETGNNSWNPVNNYVHQNVCVDTWSCSGDKVGSSHLGCCKHTGVECFSFGFKRKLQFPQFSLNWLGWNFPVTGATMKGHIYKAPRANDRTIIDTHITTITQDKKWYVYMIDQRLGLEDGYIIAVHNCRRYSQWEFSDAPLHYSRGH